jgi:excinuclease ABC subunit B
VMEGARSETATDRSAARGGKGKRQTAVTSVPRNLADLARESARLEQQMYAHARNLEFEQAAALRDRLETLRQLELELGPNPPPVTETRLKSAL